MNDSRYVLYRLQERNRQRYMRRLQLPDDDGGLTRGQCLGIVAALAAVAVLALVLT